MRAPDGSLHKRVLYYTRRRPVARSLLGALTAVGPARRATEPGRMSVSCDGVSYSFTTTHDIDRAMHALHQGFFNLVLLDLREPHDLVGARQVDDFERGLALLDQMDREPDIERRYGFHRILVLVSGHDASELDRRIATLGARGVGRVLRDPTECGLHPRCRYLPTKAQFATAVLREIAGMTLHRTIGEVALCASGGGITGLYFELGALKCIEDCCSPGTLNELDQYYGISAGGVATAMLANGYTVSEFMGAIAGEQGGRIPPLDLNLLDADHLDVWGLTAPVRQFLAIVGNGLLELVRGRLPFSFESLVFEYGDLVHAPFNTDGFEQLLRSAFLGPGCTNDFRLLGRRLYIGATDQDRKTHVLFGAPPFEHVPISRAIQASMSINPVFAPTLIDDRYYEDGAVTRTSNFVEAIVKGADLIIALDPLVPHVSKEAGVARERGIFYNADQDIRTVSFTRFDTTRKWVLRRHPEVSLYTFLPANNLRQRMSVNPMDHRPFLEIWRGAYLSTLKRIHALGYRMHGDLAAHGIAFETARADDVAARLRHAERPSFADFFPDARVDLGVPSPSRRRGPELVKGRRRGAA